MYHKKVASFAAFHSVIMSLRAFLQAFDGKFIEMLEIRRILFDVFPVFYSITAFKDFIFKKLLKLSKAFKKLF